MVPLSSGRDAGLHIWHCHVSRDYYGTRDFAWLLQAFPICLDLHILTQIVIPMLIPTISSLLLSSWHCLRQFMTRVPLSPEVTVDENQHWSSKLTGTSVDATEVEVEILLSNLDTWPHLRRRWDRIKFLLVEKKVWFLLKACRDPRWIWEIQLQNRPRHLDHNRLPYLAHRSLIHQPFVQFLSHVDVPQALEANLLMVHQHDRVLMFQSRPTRGHLANKLRLSTFWRAWLDIMPGFLSRLPNWQSSRGVDLSKKQSPFITQELWSKNQFVQSCWKVFLKFLSFDGPNDGDNCKKQTDYAVLRRLVTTVNQKTCSLAQTITEFLLCFEHKWQYCSSQHIFPSDDTFQSFLRSAGVEASELIQRWERGAACKGDSELIETCLEK